MYDSRADVLEHRKQVRKLIQQVVAELIDRQVHHDASKLCEPEKSLYDEFKPKLEKVELEFGYGSPQYESLVKELNVAFHHHFEVNRHHPEHFENGVSGMTLIDVVEMLCDWTASAGRYGKSPSIEANQRRFGISNQLAEILQNTVEEMNW